jgi:nitronate monooxygenase
MWPNTQITELLNITLPLIQAPMAGGATTPELVAAVSNAGGLGSLGAGYMTANEIRNAIKQIRQLTNKPFGVNLFIPEKYQVTEKQIKQAIKAAQEACFELNFDVPPINPPYTPSFEEQIDLILEEKVKVFSFTFGIPNKHQIENFKNNNVILIGTATTLKEAKLLEEFGIDAVVAQGSEAGGHRGTFIGKSEDALNPVTSLVPLLLDYIKIPVIAAGGIMDAKGIIESFTLGAAAVQMGTAFLCCNESGIHPLYKLSLLNATQDRTVLTRAFSGKLARGITNKFISRMQAHEQDILDYPIQNTLTSAIRKEAGKKNGIDFMSLWAGQFAYLCKAIPAAQFIQELNDEICANQS